MSKQQELKYKKGIWILSIAIPIAVALLFLVRIPNVEPLDFLPPIYASINGVTALLLIIAYWAIINKKLILHERLMKISIFLSVVLYIPNHLLNHV